MELRLVAEWEKNSAMPEVYVHLSGGDIERKMLENAGLIDIDEKGPDHAGTSEVPPLPVYERL